MSNSSFREYSIYLYPAGAKVYSIKTRDELQLNFGATLGLFSGRRRSEALYFFLRFLKLTFSFTGFELLA